MVNEGSLTLSEALLRITDSNAKLEGGWKKLAHCSACEVTMTSLHVPPTHLRVNKALVELQELALSLCVSCLRGKPVDTRVSWIPNTTDSDPRRPQFRATLNAYRHRSLGYCNNNPALLRVSEDLALYRIKPVCPVDLSNNTRNKIPATPQARHNHPDRSQSSVHPHTKAECVLPVDRKAGVTFIGPEVTISTGR